MANPTILDVAKKAGVSKTLASDILRGAAGYRCRPDTEERVRMVAMELGYQAHAAARLLRAQNKRLIGLAVAIDHELRLDRYVVAVHREVVNRGYQPALIEPNHLHSTHSHMPFPSLDMLAGVVSADMRMEQVVPEFYGDLAARLPLIALYPTRSAAVEVVTTDRVGQYDVAIEHLREMGHRRIACATNFAGDAYSDQLKVTGWQRAVKKYDLDPNPEFAISNAVCQPFEPEMLEQCGAHIAHTIVNMKTRPTALICLGDDLALNAMRHFSKLGLKVPGDIAMLAFERVGCAMLSQPSLTTVVPNYEAIAKAAVDRLISKIEEESPLIERLPLQKFIAPQLVPRESTARSI